MRSFIFSRRFPVAVICSAPLSLFFHVSLSSYYPLHNEWASRFPDLFCFLLLLQRPLLLWGYIHVRRERGDVIASLARSACSFHHVFFFSCCFVCVVFLLQDGLCPPPSSLFVFLQNILLRISSRETGLCDKCPLRKYLKGLGQRLDLDQVFFIILYKQIFDIEFTFAFDTKLFKKIKKCSQ